MKAVIHNFIFFVILKRKNWKFNWFHNLAVKLIFHQSEPSCKTVFQSHQMNMASERYRRSSHLDASFVFIISSPFISLPLCLSVILMVFWQRRLWQRGCWDKKLLCNTPLLLQAINTLSVCGSAAAQSYSMTTLSNWGFVMATNKQWDTCDINTQTQIRWGPAPHLPQHSDNFHYKWICGSLSRWID